jgi:nitrogen fixation NifU-like protein/NifU-like protein
MRGHPRLRARHLPFVIGQAERDAWVAHLRAAIDDYYRRHGMEDRIQALGPRVVCHCLNVTAEDIEHAVLEGARSFEELQERTKIGTGCGECQEEAQRVLSSFIEKHFGL